MAAAGASREGGSASAGLRGARVSNTSSYFFMNSPTLRTKISDHHSQDDLLVFSHTNDHMLLISCFRCGSVYNRTLFIIFSK